MKTKLFAIGLVLSLTAAAATDAAPVAGAPANTWLNFYNVLVTALTPIVIFGIKWVVPKIPKVALPIAAPILGVAIDWALKKVGVPTDGGLQGLFWGALGVWLREFQDQSRKAIIGAPPDDAGGTLSAKVLK